VTQGYLRYLRIQGIGYRAALQDQTLTFKLGYSHDITYTLPTSLRAFLPEPTLVGIYGIDKTQVPQAFLGSVCVSTGHGAGEVKVDGWKFTALILQSPDKREAALREGLESPCNT
jgi:hypothetical protein